MARICHAEITVAGSHNALTADGYWPPRVDTRQHPASAITTGHVVAGHDAPNPRHHRRAEPPPWRHPVWPCAALRQSADMARQAAGRPSSYCGAAPRDHVQRSASLPTSGAPSSWPAIHSIAAPRASTAMFETWSPHSPRTVTSCCKLNSLNDMPYLKLVFDWVDIHHCLSWWREASEDMALICR